MIFAWTFLQLIEFKAGFMGNVLSLNFLVPIETLSNTWTGFCMDMEPLYGLDISTLFIHTINIFSYDFFEEILFLRNSECMVKITFGKLLGGIFDGLRVSWGSLRNQPISLEFNYSLRNDTLFPIFPLQSTLITQIHQISLRK